MYNRRQFIGAIGRPAAVAAAMIAINPQEIINVKEAAANLSSTPEEIAQDESFWFKVQQAFSVDRSLVNLNSGGVSPAPTGVQDAMKRYLDYSNTAPVYSMWRILEPQREGVRKRLAIFFDCDPEEIALTRNASEGLQICQFGFDLKPGDEVLTTNQDYPRMITTWQQRERREKIILKQFSLPVPSEDEDEIVDLFRKNISNKTKLILMCHMINLTGQLLPVKKVVNMARERGIPVIVDGAHSFAHIDFKIRDLDCDYFATSLHKWLYAPHGTGLLYVQQNKIKDLWPMMAASENLDTDIRKFEEIGTHPAANYLAIADALTFNEGIGLRRKEARMRYLRDYWVKKLLTYEEIQLHTSLKPNFSCGIANVQIRSIESGALTQYLWKNYRIIVTTIKHPEFEGLRVSPNLFTTLEELDRFIVAMKMAIEKGIES
jgi:selenocysteine lyase/cysteine desulfurase